MWASLRKFGLNDSSFPTMIDNVAFLLRIMIVNIYKDGTKRISWAYYLLTLITGSCYFYVYIFSMLWLVCVYYPSSKKYTEAIVVMSVSVCGCTCVTKFLFMKLHASVKKRALIIWIWLVLNGAAYAIIPFLRTGRHLAEDLYIFYGLDPIRESPNYEVASIVSTISIGFAVYTMVNVAVYVIIIVGYNEAQIYTISEEVQTLWDDSQNFYNKIKYNIRNKLQAVHIKEEIVNEFIRLRLKNIIQYHVTNIHFFKDLNNEFRFTLAIEYSIMGIAIIAELLGGLENTYVQLPYTIVQIFMDCLSGQRIIDACNDLEMSIYGCQWENFNTSNRKTVLIMLINSQKTLMLSAGGMAKLNYSCLMMIFKSTYSAYTALKSTI